MRVRFLPSQDNMNGHLICGDNLEAMREMKRESVDLIYADPPFNTGKDFGAFDDRWKDVKGRSGPIVMLARAAHSPAMAGYVYFMEQRIYLFRELLKETGSVYVHCDQASSHFLRILLDRAFGAKRYRNSIIWKRAPAGMGAMARSKQWPREYDVILVYSKGSEATFIQQYTPLNDASLSSYSHADAKGPYKKCRRGNYTDVSWPKFRAEGRIHVDPSGGESLKYYLDEAKGEAIGSVWVDISSVVRSADDRTGYPTQKPELLLERIIRASSNEGDVILDPFCGSGTALVVADRLDRKWVGIDLNKDAIRIAKMRIDAR